MSAVDADGAGGGLLVFLLIAALLVFLGAAAELYDFKRKRAGDDRSQGPRADAPPPRRWPRAHPP